MLPCLIHWDLSKFVLHKLPMKFCVSVVSPELWGLEVFPHLLGENAFSVQCEFPFLFLWVRLNVFSFKPFVMPLCVCYFVFLSYPLPVFLLLHLFRYWPLRALCVIDKFSPLSVIWVTNIYPRSHLKKCVETKTSGKNKICVNKTKLFFTYLLMHFR